MAERTQISPSSPHFGYLEYLLQLSLHASTARIVSAHALSNPHLTIQFERRCKDVLTLDSWVDAADLIGGNTEEEIIRRGFRFEQAGSGVVSGMKFPVGRIHFDPKKKGNLRKLVLCKIGVGRAYVADEATASRDTIPEGYDSYYLTSSQNKGAKTNDEDYYCEYYIKNGAQVLPLYVVHYEFDPLTERRSREKPKCDNCETAFASVFCSADNANLCSACDHQLHSHKLAARHQRTPIGKGADVFGNCRHHPDKLVEFFCSTCHMPVCVYCKMVGHHSSGEAARHKLVSVADAYQTVVSESQMSDTILSTRRTNITNQLTAINNRAKAVEKLATSIQGQIEEIYRKALHDLKTIVKKKLDVLLGDELELKRQVSEIARLEEFLKYQQTGDATHFLFSWARHQQVRSDLHDFKFFRDEIDVNLDVKVAGSINVLVDDPTPPVSRAASHMAKKPPAMPAPTAGVSYGGMVMSTPTPHAGSAASSSHHTSSAHTSHGAGDRSAKPSKSFALGMGYPKVMAKAGHAGGTHRRTSDFFSETLGALDEISVCPSSIHEGDSFSMA